MKKFAYVALAGLLASFAFAERVYLMTSEDTDVDTAVVNALTSRGHTVTIGQAYHLFDGTADLSDIDVVFMQANANWAVGDMPQAGQEQLIEFMSLPGRGIVTTEWIIWKWSASGHFQMMGDLFPVQDIDGYYRSDFAVTYTRSAPNPIMDDGVSSPFSYDATNYAGTESYFVPRPGALVFYASDYSIDDEPGGGVVGFSHASGARTVSFSTCGGPDSMGNGDYAQLVSNAVKWVTRGAGFRSGDANGDGCVDDTDLAITLALFGLTGENLAADYNSDGTVDDTDLAIVLSFFGAGC